jgi:hypothetical protein
MKPTILFALALILGGCTITSRERPTNSAPPPENQPPATGAQPSTEPGSTEPSSTQPAPPAEPERRRVPSVRKGPAPALQGTDEETESTETESTETESTGGSSPSTGTSAPKLNR